MTKCEMISLFFSLVTGAEEWMMISAGLTFILAKVLGKVAGIFYSNQQPFAELNQVNLLIEKEVNNSFPSDHTIFIFSICMVFWLSARALMYFCRAMNGWSRNGQEREPNKM
ncbi:phosphatase PAP2 family protein [Bacillus altitudinis]|uniref:Phosphatase PAP2 family protein n=1 Tax=Bacillus altitudinis TaxID=293387 RepID=A0ABV1S740_BACAB